MKIVFCCALFLVSLIDASSELTLKRDFAVVGTVSLVERCLRTFSQATSPNGVLSR